MFKMNPLLRLNEQVAKKEMITRQIRTLRADEKQVDEDIKSVQAEILEYTRTGKTLKDLLKEE